MMIRDEAGGEGEGMLWKIHSTTMQPVGTRVGMTIVPYNIHIMHKPKTADAEPAGDSEDKEA